MEDGVTTEALQAELADLQRKLRARSGIPAYASNVVAIQARIDEIKKELPPDNG